MDQLSFHKNSASTPPPRQSLSIIDHALRTYKLWCDIRKKFPKDCRYTLGAEIDNALIGLLKSTFTASSIEQKLSHIENARTHCDLVKFLLRVAWEIEVLENKKYIALSEPLNHIGNMLGAWYNNFLAKTQPPPKRG